MAENCIKLSCDILDDAKMDKMDDHTFRRCMQFFLLAKRQNDNGYLPQIDDMAYTLHTTIEDVCESLCKLDELGIIKVDITDDSESYFVVNFQKRQKKEEQEPEKDDDKRQTRRDYMRDYMRDYRKSRKSVNSVNNVNTVNSLQVYKSLQKFTSLQEKEEGKEEKDSPLSPSFLSSSPLIPPNNNHITPFNPPLRKEEREEEKESTANAETLFAFESESVQKPKSAKRNEKTAQDVSISVLDSPKRANEKPKLQPEDDEFWNFAKEEKSRAQAFYQATGLYPLKGEFGRWVKDLRKFSEASVSIDAMVSAIEKLHTDGITIKAPGSVLGTARSMTTLRASPEMDRWDRAELELENRIADLGLFGFSGAKGNIIDV